MFQPFRPFSKKQILILKYKNIWPKLSVAYSTSRYIENFRKLYLHLYYLIQCLNIPLERLRKIKKVYLRRKIPLLRYADNFILLREDMETIKLNTMLMKTNKELGL